VPLEDGFHEFCERPTNIVARREVIAGFLDAHADVIQNRRGAGAAPRRAIGERKDLLNWKPNARGFGRLAVCSDDHTLVGDERKN
jgi:hypothetical protein